jgi:hypothetical protein
MALMAGGVKMPQDLTDALSTIGGSGTAGINNIYGQARQRQAGDMAALGRAPSSNSYGGQRLGVQQGLDQGNLEASLGGVLGDTGYKNTLAERDYNQNRQLAEETAALNKPSLLQQIMQGIGSVGKTAATYYGMKGMNSGSQLPANYQPGPNYGPMSLYQGSPYGYGGSPYGQ